MILAAKIVTARDHENADRLRVYTVEAPGIEVTQIIANKDTLYEVGDTAAAALIGTMMSDGTVIEKSKIRGVLSFGMLLGKTPEPPGTDLTERMGAKHVEKKVDESQGVVDESNWPRYTSIDGLLRVRDEILAVSEVVVSEKVHGSNFRAGYHGSRPFMVGTHTSRVVDDRLDLTTWPEGHLIRKSLEWVERENLRDRIATFRSMHPGVRSLAIFGEISGFKCSDLHYGCTESKETRVMLFGEVAVDGQFLGYDDAIDVLGEVFPDRSLGEMMVPVLYRGKPDLKVFKRLRDQPSVLAAKRGAEQINEGIVIRPTTESVSKATMNRLIAKFKGPLYEERKSLRDVDPGVLPVYVNAYDLLYDFVTDERIRHVVAKAEGSGMTIEPKKNREIAKLLYADIRKESSGEWPAGSEALDEGTLARWTSDIAGESIARIVGEWGK